MTDEELQKAFKGWWIAEHETWPEQTARFEVTIGPTGHVLVKKLPDDLNPLVREVFTRENGAQYAPRETQKVIGQAVNAIKNMFIYVRGPQWETATMDDFFKLNPKLSVLKRTPNLGPRTLGVVLAIMNSTKTNRFDWR